jgi:hypothetical protein
LDCAASTSNWKDSLPTATVVTSSACTPGSFGGWSAKPALSAFSRVLRQQRTRLKLRGFVYFSWRDGRPSAPLFKNLWGLHTGLLTVKGKRKPAYNAFVRAVRPLTR